MRMVAVTGASGFLGRQVVGKLAASGYRVRALTRAGGGIASAAETIATGDIVEADLEGLVAGCDAVVNCTARVHILRREDPAFAERQYRRINGEFPLRLAEVARRAGARRFVQISSVAAVMSQTPAGSVVDDGCPPEPTTPYGSSKLLADIGLAQLDREGFRTVSLRPPALIGPGVTAWFAALVKAARIAVPLPIGRIDNRRSFAFVGNVASSVVAAVEQEHSGCFIVTDSVPLSTASLYRKLLMSFGHPDLVWSWPPELVRKCAQFALRGRADSLLGNAAFDGVRFTRLFGWAPEIPFDRAILMTTGTDE
ncbi:NAD-dependent epimerase/dehydratase family protein [Sphingopyxis alaskensis]|jgi:nucleoside-diphosphate-sugar epimerase|uniref:NAD-dependent epimerase/dehydratase n=2 Tax=Sphingopyxis alaskensis TaxID=117207 RepID=Q1GSS2_SPHAL|nr:NAD-dependent epimerase/dehydratase family protein [Sphingopyxis alaskensis]ABF53300.1 NAD-dependent epimerase/dehydratase [Sphingopyxis alaskensis RB2256]